MAGEHDALELRELTPVREPFEQMIVSVERAHGHAVRVRSGRPPDAVHLGTEAGSEADRPGA